MSNQISGWLLLRVLQVEGLRQPDKLVCILEFENKSTKLVYPSTSFRTDEEEAFLDVPEFHGSSIIKVSIGLRRVAHTFKDRLLHAVHPLKTARSTHTWFLRDTLPFAHKSSFINKFWWGSPPAVPPTNWREYWPNFRVKMADSHISLALLFVPILSPERCLGGFTEAHKAAYLGDASLVRLLLKHAQNSHCRLRTQDSQSLTILDLAASRGHSNVVTVIVEDCQPSYFADFTKRTSLHYACMSGSVDIVCLVARFFGHLLLVLDAQDENGWTALHMVCEQQRERNMAQAVFVLAEHYANPHLVNKQGDTPLLVACRHGSFDCAIALLSITDAQSSPFGPRVGISRPNLANYAGERSLDCASFSHSCPELLHALLQASAVPGLRRYGTGFTALHCAAQSGYLENCTVLVNWLDKQMEGVSHDISRFLSGYAGSPFAQSSYFTLYRDHRGRLASEVARESGHALVCEYLVAVEKRHFTRFQASLGCEPRSTPKALPSAVQTFH